VNRSQLADSTRRLARDAQSAFPTMSAHHHLRDAARQLDQNRPENAVRHLHAAISSFTPLNMVRHGVSDDTGRIAGKRLMVQAHRHLLLAKDLADAPPAPQGRQFANRPERTLELVAQVREAMGL
jgi:hypothetical protein